MPMDEHHSKQRLPSDSRAVLAGWSQGWYTGSLAGQRGVSHGTTPDAAVPGCYHSMLHIGVVAAASQAREDH